MTDATCRCGAHWTGTRMCHCGACHRSFSSVGVFDKHRSQYGERGACLDPVAVLDGKGQPAMTYDHTLNVWRGPEPDEDTRQRLAAFRRTA